MGLIEGVFCEVHHFIINVTGNAFGNSLFDASRNPFLLIAVDEIRPLLLHDGLLLLTHGPSNKVTSAKGIPSQIPYDLHNLLLVNDTAVSRLQDRLQLRAGIGNARHVILSF